MTSHPTPALTVTALYRHESARLGYVHDQAQELVVARLDDLRERLLARPNKDSLLKSLLPKKRSNAVARGLYIYGGVGRGKTWLMDLFFQSLPFKEKQRSHFHRFMQFVHDELKKHSNEVNPLEKVADKVAKRARLLCFDELFVADIADAMLLGTLLGALFDRGITLVATSNVAPDDLYKDGLQRSRFMPAIRRIQEHTEIVHMAAGTDYRLRLLERARTWFDSSSQEHTRALEALFIEVAGEPGTTDSTLTLNHRRLKTHRQADDVVWFTFKELCDGPRGQADYIELAKCYHTVFLSEVPVLTIEHENQARRFISLVDEFYDRAVKLVISAAAPITDLYRGKKLSFEFERTRSRLIEMQSQQYLAREHRP